MLEQKDVQNSKEILAQKEENKKKILPLKDRIDKMTEEQASLQAKLKEINAQQQELYNQIKKTKENKAKLKEKMAETEKKKKAAEKRKNRPLRKRYLMEAAQAFLNEFPSLKKTFYASITKEDYSTNGSNLKGQFVEIARYWKSTHPVDAIPDPKPVLTKVLEEGTHEPIKKEETPPQASGFDFAALNASRSRLPEDAKDVPNKYCPKCGAPAITWVSKKYNKSFYGCKNNRLFGLGSANCDFHSPQKEDLKDAPDVDAK